MTTDKHQQFIFDLREELRRRKKTASDNDAREMCDIIWAFIVAKHASWDISLTLEEDGVPND